jgi:hypothetical protein
MAVCVLAQVLNRRFLLAIRWGMTKQQEKGADTRTPSSQTIINDVQKIVGWAIFSLREGRKKKLEKASDVSDGDMVVKIESELDFLAEMRSFHHEIIDNQDYIKNCYPSRLLLENRGFLTLVSPTFFDFGKQLVEFVCTHFTAKRIQTEGNTNARKAMNELCIQNKTLEKAFLQSAVACRVLTVQEKVKIYEELIAKVAHSRVGEIMRAYRDEKLVKGKKHASKGNFRSDLRAKSGSHDVGKTIKKGGAKVGPSKQKKKAQSSGKRKAPPPSTTAAPPPPQQQQANPPKKARSRYSDSDKNRALESLKAPGATVASVSREFSINESTLRSWKKEHSRL